mmetsp:Transcript_9847/g.36574  ORF Transcript_9847/g.36574 Transcript_9847/m.36574 type:complete len:222 (-) Transcript_9847:23-688(-)
MRVLREVRRNTRCTRVSAVPQRRLATSLGCRARRFRNSRAWTGGNKPFSKPWTVCRANDEGNLCSRLTNIIITRIVPPPLSVAASRAHSHLFLIDYFQGVYFNMHRSTVAVACFSSSPSRFTACMATPAALNFSATYSFCTVRPFSLANSKYGTMRTARWRLTRHMSRNSVRIVFLVEARDASPTPPGAAPSPPSQILMKWDGPSNSSATSSLGRYTSTEK